jgi:hypothetical protein
MSFTFSVILSPAVVVSATISRKRDDNELRARVQQCDRAPQHLPSPTHYRSRLWALPATPFLRLFAGFIFRGPLPASRRRFLRPAPPFFRRHIPPPLLCAFANRFPELLCPCPAEHFLHRALPPPQFIGLCADTLNQKFLAGHAEFLRVSRQITVEGLRQMEPRRNAEVVRLGRLGLRFFRHAAPGSVHLRFPVPLVLPTEIFATGTSCFYNILRPVMRDYCIIFVNMHKSCYGNFESLV